MMNNNQDNLINITTLSSFTSQHFSIEAPSGRFSSFLLLYVSQGEGHCWMDTVKTELVSGTVYCVYPGQLIAPVVSSVMEGWVISFEPEFPCLSKDDVLWNLMHGSLFDTRCPGSVIMPEEEWRDLRRLFTAMAREMTGNAPLQYEALRGLLRLLMIAIVRNSSPKKEEGVRHRDMVLVSTFYELVNKYLVTVKKVSDYAVMLGIPASYLNVIVKKISGFTAKHYIQQQVVMEAKRQLRWEGKSLKQIAYKLGYVDVAHFSKYFKKFTGTNFSEYKRSQELA